MFTLEVPFASPAYDETVRLRDEILRKPLGLSFTAEDLALEFESIHLACYNRQWELMACLVLVWKGDNLKMRQVAVDERYQRRGIGQFLVAASERVAANYGAQKLVLNARETAVPFYQKLAYSIDGNRFEEVGIPHFKMYKDLS
ncbi:MAG: GNAT family N-acetyltransferase [Bacteroidota bacterium]